MKARNISRQAPGGERTPLARALPLKTPIVIQLFPVYACNFKCRYCVFSVDKAARGFISDKITMDMDLYKKVIDDISAFPEKVKVLRFVGMGEPLLHNNLPAMIKYAASNNIAHRLEVLTNASLLAPKVSDDLVSAGLSRLVVSLQGTSSRKYQEVSGVNINMESFIGNLEYFYRHRGKTHLHIKIIDYALEGKEDEQNFFHLFGDICDTLGIEHAGPIFPSVDYEPVLRGKNPSLTQFGLPVSKLQICPQPFFTLQVNPDGKVVPCYSIAYPSILGDCNNDSLYEIWKGGRLRQFQRKMLDGVDRVCETCSQCKISGHRLFPEDDISQAAERLKRYYEA
jgi:radical SAM protein with 4Fe4S-binding SPASM domain